MPDETLIAQIENLLAEVVELGGQNERSSIVPNLTVVNANPAGLSGFVIISDDRDGDNILAKKVGSVVYSDNDLVNVMFLRGGEAIAFQQGSQSSNNGIWEIVPSTSTDIFYDKGDVGIGKAIAPDAALEILDTSQAQLRLTHTEDTVFADFTLDSGDDLTINPSSTGQIILDATVAIIDELQHKDDTDNKIGFTDDVQTYTVGGVELLKLTEDTQDLINLGPGSGDVDIDFNGDMFLRGSDGFLGIGTTSPDAPLHSSGTGVRAIFGDGTANAFIEFDGGVSSRDMRYQTAGVNRWILRVDGSAESGSDAGSNFVLLRRDDAGAALGTAFSIIRSDGYVGINRATPRAQLEVDQTSSTAADPVLWLRQVDVDEPFIMYQGTAAAATLTRSIVAEADVTTATRQGFVKIEVQDDGNQVTDQDYFVPFYTLA